ncbi:MAG: hypothetical protein JWP49_2204 [Phenylobacterium sp.]|nr:hypothetical protein [Phenylobacterium sp.]
MAHRPHPPYLRDRVLARVTAGELIADICAEPGMPSAAGVSFWARRDAHFRDALQAAKSAGRFRRRFAFDETKADILLARLAAGEPVTVILADPAMPSRAAYRYWRATDGAFAAEVVRLNQVKRDDEIARCRRRFRPFDRARADAILARVISGARLCDVPEAPARQVLTRWRRDEPAFDAELKAVMAFARTRRRQAGGATPELLDKVWGRVLEGQTLATVGLQRDMPCRTTLYAWMKRNPAFRDTVAQALHFRRDWLGDLSMEVGRRRCAGDRGAKREWESLAGQASRIEARLARWGHYD